jgi:hypothetical protein
MRSSHSLDRLQVAFDDDHSVANAGLILSATLLEHLGLEQLFDEHVDLGNRDGHFLPGRKAMTIVQAMVAGADSIDDCGVLRAGETEKVLSHKVMAPSTLGTFLRAFSFGHVRQLDKITEEALGRAWAAGTGPGDGPLVIDVDSTVCPLHGYHKQGAAYGYTKVLGHHPLLATRAGTGEVLHVRHRKGSANTARGAPRFLKETFGRVRRAGAAGEITLRADSGFCSKQVIAACRTTSVHFSITVRQTRKVKAAIAEIDESSWVEIAYTPGEIAEVAETTYKDDRLIVRRVRDRSVQAQLFHTWRYHGFVTDLAGQATELDRFHRAHAEVELAIRELKENALAHLPSGSFSANAAWAVFATLAHNLVRWVASIGLETEGLVCQATLRRRHFAVPGRITRSARRETLHLPTRWPWRAEFLAALARLRSVRLVT